MSQTSSTNAAAAGGTGVKSAASGAGNNKAPEKSTKRPQRSALGRLLLWLIFAPIRLFGLLGSLLFVILVAVLVLVIYVTGTTAGGLQLLRMVGDVAPVGLTVESADGYLLKRLTLNGVAIETAAADVNLQQLVLHWSPSQLLHKQLVVHEISATNGDVYLKQTEPPAEEPPPAEIPERIELPLGIQLALLNVEQIRIHPIPVAPDTEAVVDAGVEVAEAAGPMVIEKARVENLSWQQALSVARVEFVGFNADAALTELQLQPVKPFPFSVGTQWQYQLPDFPLFVGGGPLQGDLNAIDLSQQLQPPLNVSLTARLTDLLDQPGWDAKLKISDLQPATIKADLPKLTLSGDVSVTGKLQDGAPQYQSSADVSIKLPDFPGGAIKWQLSGDAEQATIASLDADWAGGTLTGGGKVAWAPALVADLKLAARNFNPEPLAAEWPGNINGDLAVQAKLVDGAPDATVELTGFGGSLRGYPLAGGVRATLSPAGQLKLQQFELKSGSASIKLAGTVDDLPVSAASDGDKPPLPRLNVNWEIDAPDLENLLPQAGGSVQSSGSAKGRLPKPEVKAKLAANAVKFGEITVGSVDADISLSDKQLWQIELDSRAIQLGAETIRQVSVSTGGGLNSHGLRVIVDADSLQASLKANGKVQGQSWSGQLDELALKPTMIGGWQLAAPAKLVAGAESAKLSRACLVAMTGSDGIDVPATTDDGRQVSRASDKRNKKRRAERRQGGTSPDRELCLQGGWSPTAGWNADVALSRLNIAYFRRFLPVNPVITTEFNGQVKAAGKPDGKLTADAELTLDAGSVVTQNDEAPRLEFGKGGLAVNLRDQQLQAKLGLPLLLAGNPSGQLAADIGYRLSDSQLSGTINTQIDDLSPIAAFSPELEETRGRLNIDFNLSGTAQRPIASGSAVVSGGQALIPAAGLELQGIEIALRGDPQGKLNLEGGLRSGSGELKLAGDMQLVEGGATADVKISGADFQALDIANARVWISPDISIALQPGKLKVGGSLTVPRAEITPKKLPESSGGISGSDDVVIVGETAEEQAAGLAVTINVLLKLGDKVNFTGFGMTADLGGQLRFRDDPAKGQRATGELLVRSGRYKALGQDLSITDGRLIFAGGDVGNPGIDIRATRTATDNTVAGLLVRGTVRKPQFSVYSNPPYPDDIALAYLVTGRPPGGASDAETDAMSAAVGALAQSGGSFLAQRVGSRLGIDDIQFSAGDSLEAATITIGRYLTPKLYISYGVGLFDSESAVQMRYSINDRLKLETQSGTEIGGDLFYSIER